MIIELNKLEIYKEKTTSEMFTKLLEEVTEVHNELSKHKIMIDKTKLASEILDVMQCCIGLAETQNIKLENYLKLHNIKLENRGHNFY